MEKVGIGKQIAFLCTGDEIVSGEVIDTNAPHFAQQLIDHNFVPGKRLAVSDDQNEIENAIRYLLHDHPVLITLGGLGPTSDDRTRFAVAAALESDLEFDESSWNRIVTLLSHLNVEISENNRQQCLFPPNTEIYPNENGTASACCITKGEQLIFMLPGPPNECQPIFKMNVLPKLLKTNLQQKIYRRSWMLLGVSEGKIAKNLDPLMKGSGCDIGYRVNYPYLEVKLRSTNKTALERLLPTMETQLQDRLISRDKQSASQLFFQYLENTKETLSISDKATQGRLASALLYPSVYKKLSFCDRKASFNVKLEGLEAYWNNHHTDKAEMRITISKNGEPFSNQILNVPIRGEKTLLYAVELICEYLLKTLR